MTDDDDAPKKKPDRRAGDAAVLALSEGLLAAMGKTASPSDLKMLRDVVETYPDDGRDGAGEVVASLVGLLNDLLASRQSDRQALAVHIRAWRFMVSRKPDKAERAKVMLGLKAVRELYAPPSKAA
ncbi:MAG: hypothetical protein KKE02_23865 [Alphaproteobacteria bacterium]|nr:hypothetical protein [Alphaproteobacteria bacterium]MBU1514911.1 hypothetical protein [Alphaproteobacteria bacterium]MBU2093832.1 hypothetical protein [Alphaproteobacteria bacterium]MBU2154074.1 hypothetical protein [Alphaproteobacteria bacterium]MBU2305413.1 hypothetical protein [Alphaproteobacteria bacterium]